MTEKRFVLHEHDDYGDAIEDTITGDWLDSSYQYMEKMNKLNDENNEIKQLINTMLVQIDGDKINNENTRYSAGIIFTGEEFKKILQIWKGD